MLYGKITNKRGKNRIMAVTADAVYIDNFTKTEIKKVVKKTTLLKMLFKKIENIKRLMNEYNSKHWSLFA